MKTNFPLWALPCKRRKLWREMRDVALDACERLNLKPDVHGKVIYEALSACAFNAPGLLTAVADLFAASGECGSSSRQDRVSRNAALPRAKGCAAHAERNR